MIFFARSGENEVIAEHRRKGAAAVYTRDNTVVLATGDHEINLMSLDRVPLTHAGRIGFQVENTLVAPIAAAWGLGIPAELIRIRRRTSSRRSTRTRGGSTSSTSTGRPSSSTTATTLGPDRSRRRHPGFPSPQAGDRLLDRRRPAGPGPRPAGGDPEGELRSAWSCTKGTTAAAAAGRDHQADLAGDRRRRPDGQGLPGPGGSAACELALSKLDPDELMVIQADVVDETVGYLRQRYGVHLPGALQQRTRQ